MARVHVTISRVDDRGDTGAALPVITSVPEAAETLTSTGFSAKSTITADRADGRVWTVVADGPVFVRFGADPTAASGVGHLILGGQVRDFSVTTSGEKIAVVNA